MWIKDLKKIAKKLDMYDISTTTVLNDFITVNSYSR